MLDLRAIQFLSSIPVNNIEPVYVFRVLSRRPSTIVDAHVDGIWAPFMVDGAAAFVSMPSGTSYNTATSIKLSHSAGEPEMFTRADFAALSADQDNGSKVSAAADILLIRGRDFSEVTAVKINGGAQVFTVLSRTSLLSRLPDSLRIHSVEVLSKSGRTAETTAYDYLLGDTVDSVEGEQKLTSQFLSCLLTTPGSDSFDRSNWPAGGMQGWNREIISIDNQYALAAKITSDIARCAALFSVRQLALDIPDEEKLASVNVTNVAMDPDNPGSVNVEIRIVSRKGLSQTLGLLIDQSEGIVRDQLARSV